MDAPSWSSFVILLLWLFNLTFRPRNKIKGPSKQRKFQSIPTTHTCCPSFLSVLISSCRVKTVPHISSFLLWHLGQHWGEETFNKGVLKGQVNVPVKILPHCLLTYPFLLPQGTCRTGREIGLAVYRAKARILKSPPMPPQEWGSNICIAWFSYMLIT